MEGSTAGRASSWRTAACIATGTAKLVAGKHVLDDDRSFVLKGLGSEGRIEWESTFPGKLCNLISIDPERAVAAADSGLLMIRSRDGASIGEFEDSASCRALGAYAGKLVSKIIDTGVVKIHDLESYRLVAKVGSTAFGDAILGTDGTYLVLREGWVFRAYRLREAGADRPIERVGAIDTE